MADIVYPAELPCFEEDSLSVTPKPCVIQTSMDVGPAKRRRRDTVTEFAVKGSKKMTKEQFSIFETFFFVSLGAGVKSFDWHHPLDSGRPMEFSFDHGDTPYSYAVAGHYVRVSVSYIMRIING